MSKKIDTHWKSVERRYEKVIQRKLDLHFASLDAIEDIENETEFEMIDWEIIVRDDFLKELEISELKKRFVMSEDEAKQHSFNLRNKVRRWKPDKSWKLIDEVEIVYLSDLT